MVHDSCHKCRQISTLESGKGCQRSEHRLAENLVARISKEVLAVAIEKGNFAPLFKLKMVALMFSIRNSQRSLSVCFCSCPGIDGSVANAPIGLGTATTTT